MFIAKSIKHVPINMKVDHEIERCDGQDVMMDDCIANEGETLQLSPHTSTQGSTKTFIHLVYDTKVTEYFSW